MAEAVPHCRYELPWHHGLREHALNTAVAKILRRSRDDHDRYAAASDAFVNVNAVEHWQPQIEHYEIRQVSPQAPKRLHAVSGVAHGEPRSGKSISEQRPEIRVILDN